MATMKFVGSSDTRSLDIQGTENWPSIMTARLDSWGFAKVALFGISADLDLEKLIRPSNCRGDLLVLSNGKDALPCIPIPIKGIKQSQMSKFDYLVAFKPNSQAPIHVLTREHALEEIAKQIFECKPSSLEEKNYLLNESGTKVPLECLITEA